jgi:hypothetical protein
MADDSEAAARATKELIESIVGFLETILTRYLVLSEMLRVFGVPPVSDASFEEYLKEHPSLRDDAQRLLAHVYDALKENSDSKPDFQALLDMPPKGGIH